MEAKNSVSDPNHFYVDVDLDSDPAFHFNAESHPAFNFIANPDPDPAPNQGDANLRPLAYRPSMPLF
jgi:hypothetical protein